MNTKLTLLTAAGRARHSVRAAVSQFQNGAHGVTRPTSKLWLLLCVLASALGLTAHAQAPAASGTILTIAGNGTGGFSGDGGVATNASFSENYGLAIGPDGTLFVADSGNFRIRAIHPVTGIITTIAGNGTIGDTGNDGPATNATLSGVTSVTVDRARHALYFADIDNNWVRKVNLTNGLLTRYAGTGIFGFGFSGDGGPATSAELALPVYVCTDGTGRLSIADVLNNRIRRVNPVTGIITNIAGNGNSFSAGDGGPATAASFTQPDTVAADSAGNVFVLDAAGNFPDYRIRRINAVSGIITTVAGGSTNSPGSGPATNMNLGNVTGLAVSDAGKLFIANFTQVFVVDLATGQLTPFAGTNIAGFSGDGGPALAARFSAIGGLTLAPGGGLLISDWGNGRIRYVVPDSINLTNDSGQTAFHLPWANALTNLTVANNPNLTVVNVASLILVSGDLAISGNTSANVVNAGNLTTVGGSLTIDGNTAADTIDVSSLVSVGGDLNLSGNSSAGVVNAGNLTTVGGSLTIDGNTAADTIDSSSLASVGGDLVISGNTSANVVNAGNLTTVGGSMTIDGNTAADTIDASSLISAGGNLNISGNTSANVVNAGNLTTVGGSTTIGGNTSADAIDTSSLASVGSDLDISGNTSADVVNAGNLTTVGGDLTIASNAPNANVNLNSLTNYGCGTNEVTMTLDGGTFALTNGLTLCTNATLAGSSTVDGSLTNNGTIEPGNSPGHLHITGRLVLGSGSTLRLEIGGPAPGQFDSLNVGGPVTLGGTLAVSLINNFPSGMTNGAGFTLLTSGSPLAGAFANVASGATLTTTDGYARFTVLYASQTSVQLANLVIVDTDSDGLPDWWEDQFSLSKTNSADAALDLDGDGASNAHEFLAGTNPTNAASVFRVVAVQRESDGVRLTWTTVGGKSYVVQTNGAVTDAFTDFSPLITIPGTGDSTTNMVTPGAATNAATGYYRVRLGP